MTTTTYELIKESNSTIIVTKQNGVETNRISVNGTIHFYKDADSILLDTPSDSVLERYSFDSTKVTVPAATDLDDLFAQLVAGNFFQIDPNPVALDISSLATQATLADLLSKQNDNEVHLEDIKQEAIEANTRISGTPDIDELTAPTLVSYAANTYKKLQVLVLSGTATVQFGTGNIITLDASSSNPAIEHEDWKKINVKLDVTPASGAVVRVFKVTA